MNIEHVGRRNLAVSRWHREAFPDDCGAFDHDLVGMCANAMCRQPLYVIEDVCANGRTLEDAANRKPTNWTERASERWGVPSILIAWNGDPQADRLNELLAWRVSLHHPRRVLIGDELDLVAFMNLVRKAHEVVHHRDPAKARKEAAA